MQQSNKDCDNYYYAMQEYNLRMKKDMLNPIEFASRNNSDNLYYHQAINIPKEKEFQKAIIKEVNYQKKSLRTSTRRKIV